MTLVSRETTDSQFSTILLGHKILVYTDHKNLTYTNFNTDRVMRWCLILEEYGPELIYTKGSTNIVADTLSRLETEPTNESIAEAKNFINIREANAMLCGVEKCNIRSDDSVLIRRLSQSYDSNNTFQGIIEVFTQIR